jgi:translocation and assembly module TamB
LSTAENLPPEYFEEPEQPRRRRSWKRIIVLTAALLVIIIAALLIGIFALLHTEGFRQYLIRKAVAEVKDIVGADIHVRDFNLHLSGLRPTVDMYDVAIDGAAPYVNPPFMQADRLGLGITIDSLIHRTWYFGKIELEHPVARIIVDEQGRNNMPVTKQTDTQTDLFDLGIRRAVITGGELYYNDHKSAIDADVTDLAFESSFDPGPKRYSGNITYHDGHLKIEGWNPMMHGLEVKFEATSDQLKVSPALLSSGPSRITINATLDDYAHPRVQAAYQATIDAASLRQTMRNDSLPAGVINTAGSMQYQEQPNVPIMKGLHVDGNMNSPSLLLQTQNTRLNANNISARYRLDQGNLTVDSMRANVLGGGLNGQLTMTDLTGDQNTHLRASLKNVGLAGLQTLLQSPIPPNVTLTGTTNADIDARWKKSLTNLVATANAGLGGTVRPKSAAPADAFPLNGEIHASYNGAREEVSFRRSFVRTPKTSMNLDGTVSRQASLSVQFQSNDLREIETIVDAFHPMEPLGLSGTASFAGSVRGSTSNPQINGQLQAMDLHVKGSNWRSLRTNVEAGPSLLRLQDAQLLAAPQGQLAFNLDTGLSNWEFTDTSPLDIKLNASQLDAATLINLTGQQVPVSGTLAANIALHGSQLSPAGEGTITLTNGHVYNEPVDSVNVNLQGTGEQLTTKLDVKAPAGTAQGNFTLFPKQKGYDGQLQAAIRLENVKSLAAKNVQATGTLSLNASGRGTLDDPQAQLTARIPQLQIQNETISDLNLQADIRDHAADVRLDSQARNAYIRGQGKVDLAGNYDVDATLDTSRISLQPVIAMYLPAQAMNVTGETELHAKVRGPLKDSSALNAQVTVPVLTLSYNKTINLAAANPIEMDYARGVLTVKRAEIRGTGTDLRVDGNIPVASNAPASLTAVGTVDLQIAELLDPDIESSGQLRLNVNSTGTAANPNMQGQIELVNANVAGGNLPLGLANGNGLLRLTSDRITIERLTGNVGGGTLTASGGITYRPSVQFNVRTNATGIRMLYPDGVREKVDANLIMSGSTEAALLSGQVRLTELSFAPDFDMAELAGEFSSAAPAAPTGLAQNIRLDIGVQSSNDLSLVSSKLSLQGAANLQVRGTAANPVVLGRMNLTGGDMIFRGNRYVLQPTTLDFINPVRTEPIVNAVIDTTVQDYDIHLRFRGTVDQLNTTYTSDPSLPPADIINLLVFGKTVEAAEANPNPGNLGAESLIASSVSNQITSRVAKVAGISHLSVDPVLGDDTKDPGARITLQQRVTGNLFVTFATDVTGTQHEVIKLEYQATPRVSLSGVRDQNGGFAVDMRIRKTW